MMFLFEINYFISKRTHIIGGITFCSLPMFEMIKKQFYFFERKIV